MIFLIIASALMLSVLGIAAGVAAKLAGVSYLTVAVPLLAGLVLYGLIVYPYLLKKARKEAADQDGQLIPQGSDTDAI